MTGWTSAATVANANGTMKPSRWAWSRRPRRIPTAYTLAARNPVTRYVATNMWTNCGHRARLKIAASGSTSVARSVPDASTTRSNPLGAFIHELTARMQNVPNNPDAMIGISVRRCTLGGRRSQPNR